MTDIDNEQPAQFITMQLATDLQQYQQLFIDNTTQYINTLLTESSTLSEKQKKLVVKQLVEKIKQFGINVVSSIEPHTLVQQSTVSDTLSNKLQSVTSDSTAQTQATNTDWHRLLQCKNDILETIELINSELPQHLTQINALTQYLTDAQSRPVSSVEQTLKSVSTKPLTVTNENVDTSNAVPEVRNSSKLAARLAMQQM